MTDIFNKILENVNCAIFIYQGNEIKYVNAYACEIAGYSKDELLSMKFWEMIHPDFLDLVKTRGINRQKKVDLPNRYTIKILTKQKKEKWLDYSAKEITYEGKSAILGIAHDVTESIELTNQIKNCLQEKVVLLGEIHHRVKNNLQIIMGLIDLHRQNVRDQYATQSFNDLSNRIKTISFIHEHLYQSEDLGRINMHNYFQILINLLTQLSEINTKNIVINVKANNITFPISIAIPCGLIVNELVVNSLKHAFQNQQNGEISVILTKCRNKSYNLIISDNGVGLAKDSEIISRDTIGLNLVNDFVKQLGGTIKVKVINGTQIKINFRC